MDTWHRRALRTLTPQTWSLVGWALLSLSFLALLASEVLGAAGTVALDDYACVVAPALAACACWRTALTTRSAETGQRRTWLLLGCSLMSWAGGGLAWTVYELYLGQEVPFPSLVDAGYLLYVPLAALALLTWPSAHPARSRLRPLLDGTIAAGALLFISWVTVLGPAFESSAGSLLSQTISLAYPVGDVVIATTALLTLAWARGQERTTMLMIGVGLLIVAVSDSAFAWFTAHAAYVSGNLFDVGYVAGPLLVGVAALRSHASRSAPVTSEGMDDARPDDAVVLPSRLALGLPYVPLLISVPAAVALQLTGHPLDGVTFYISLFVVCAVLVRQMLSIQVNLTLGERLQETVAVLRRRETELKFQAFHDPLTGLANRALFVDRMNHALARNRRSEPVILLLADLDDFKSVNDTWGHPAGDALLIGVSERLRAVVRPADTVARLGGDEFAVLLESATGLVEAQRVAARIAEALEQPFFLHEERTVVGASIGIAVAGTAASGDTLLRDADIAMYAAKSDGKGGHATYAVELATAAVERRRLQNDLGNALAAEQLSLVYQPVVELGSGRLRGMEALLRWRHPDRGDVSPVTFIPLAEASGEIVPIGRWVIEQACAQAGRWHRLRAAGAPPLRLAVNVSGRQLSDPHLVPTVREALGAAGLPADLLTLEITESVLLDEQQALTPLLELRDLGVHLAIDDFGTGHSALSRLRSYPIDTLKIDQSFVGALNADPAVADVLVSAILKMGHGLQIDVIAEGVETDDQLAVLRALGCAQGQGFLFARPAQPEVIDELIRADIALTDPVPSL